MQESPEEIQQQMQDNITWIEDAKQNKLVVGSQARILYADAQGRMKIAKAFNDAINNGEIGPVVLGRDHHDVSGTDSPFREHQIYMTVAVLRQIWLFTMLLVIVSAVQLGFQSTMVVV
eukprot:TRINITY_DN27713_c0_g1_i1.p1 TRINITY_DN27713_c0_g1~~TRINITY_DN27713_c0_g1_i1.p1  ORF type:complete len:118 (+),score=21.56 TRINITY_DN27713_c0_g1_i1:118-471(+)